MGRTIKERKGRAAKKLQYCVSALIALLLALSPIEAFALNLPDSLTFVTGTQPKIQVFRHLIDTNDWLLVAHYDIDYTNPADQPIQPATQTFLLRVMNGSTQLAFNVPFAYHDNGYGKGLISIYLTGATFVAQGMTWGAAYTVRLEENPGVFSTSAPTIYTLTSTDYDTASTQAEAKTNLGNFLLGQADSFTVPWSLTTPLTTNTPLGEVLTSTGTPNGESYLVGVIPGLRKMAGQIFSVQVAAPTVPTAVPGVSALPTCATAASTNCNYPKYVQDQPYSNPMISGALNGVGSLLGNASRAVVGTLLGFALCAVVLGLSYVKRGSLKLGLVLCPLALVLAVLDFGFPMIIYGLFDFAAAAVIAYAFFHRTSA